MFAMQLGDARKLSQDTQEALRKRAINLVVTKRKPVREVADAIGVARWTVGGNSTKITAVGFSQSPSTLR